MDLLNGFLKGVLILVDPENTPLAQKIHAGYLSCLRDCVQEGHSTDAYIQSCFGAVGSSLSLLYGFIRARPRVDVFG